VLKRRLSDAIYQALRDDVTYPPTSRRLTEGMDRMLAAVVATGLDDLD
jgi:hypothetical protein